MKRLTLAWEQKWGESERKPGKPSDNNTGLTQSEREREGRKEGWWKHLRQKHCGVLEPKLFTRRAPCALTMDLPEYPCLAISLAGSSLWEEWSWHRCGDGFLSATFWSLG